MAGRARTLFFAVAVVCACAWVAPPATAATPPDVDRLFRRGAHEVRKRQYKAALKSFQSALALDPVNVDAYYNLIQVAKMLKRCDLTILYGRAFLYFDGSSPDGRDIRKRVRRCEERTAATMGTLEVKGAPKGAEVFVDGAIQGRAPLPLLQYQVGKHEVRATHPDFEEGETASATVVAGERAVATIELKPKLFYGKLMVITKPAEGVQLFLDDKPVGTTPLAEPITVQAKRHLLRLELAEWDRWVRYVTVTRDIVTEVKATLEQTEGKPQPRKPAPETPDKPPILRR